MNQDTDFQHIVLDYYHDFGRHDMPWRQPEPDGSFDAYKILVSELMLQQTQVNRVVPKFELFIQTFPTIESLAKAELGDVLRLWSGLGYNRRAKFLHLAAVVTMTNFEGAIPENIDELVTLPGVGPNTAGAILAYAYNQPVTFIETNIRTTYIHHYFSDQSKIPDTELLPIVSRTIDRTNPREWYWALMDYGSYLKTEVGNLNRYSKHYTKQSTFAGSDRQIRGAIIRLLTESPHDMASLVVSIPDDRLESIVTQLIQEGLVHQDGPNFLL